MKSGKAADMDGIQAELLKAELTSAVDIMFKIFNTIWTKDEIPNEWSKGLIVKLAKKVDLGNCYNWRGITLISTPSKIFCRVLLNRIDKALDAILRKEQAGFRKC